MTKQHEFVRQASNTKATDTHTHQPELNIYLFNLCLVLK